MKNKNESSRFWTCVLIVKILVEWLYYKTVFSTRRLLRGKDTCPKPISFHDYWTGLFEYYHEITGETIDY